MRIEELVDRMLRGEADATREVGRRLQVGDPEAVRELGERLSRAGGKKVGEAAPPEDPAEFQADLRKLADVLTSKPCDAEPRLAALETSARPRISTSALPAWASPKPSR